MAEKPTYKELERRVQELEKIESEYKSSKEALRNSEAQYRLLFEHASVGIFVAQDGCLKVPNPCLSQILGYSLAELNEQPFSLFIHPEYLPLVNTRHRERLSGKTGLPQTYDFRVICKNGTIIWVQLSTILIQLKGRPATLNFLHDITERKRAEEALKESEATVRKKLQAILEPNGDMAPFEMSDIIDSQDLQLLMDDFFKLTGVGGAILDTRGNILASTIWQDICSQFHRVHPETRQHCTESDTALASGRAPGEIGLYKCKNNMWDVVTPIHIGGHHIGNVFYGQFFFEEETPDYETFRQQAERYGFDETAYLAALERVPRWSREKVDQIMEFYARLASMISTLGYRNIRLARALTANAELLETLQESEEKYRVLFSTFPLGITVSDHTGKIVESNAAAEQLLGISKGEHEKRHIDGAEWRIIQPDGSPMPDTEYASVRALKENRLIENVEMGIVKPDADITWINVSAAPLNLDKYGAVITYGDVTARRQADTAQALLQAQLQQAQKMESVGRLAGGVAHDFNNMLGVILGFTEMALDLAGPSEPLQKCLEEVRKAAERSTKLVQQLLAFARKQIIAPVVLDLNQTVVGMLKMLQRLIGEDIDMVWQPGPNVWTVYMDPGQIDQILANLCVNARDAIGGVGKVTIETANQVFDEDYCTRHAGFRPGDFVLMAVSDNGCGMDAHTQEHIFEPFFTTKEVGQGTGLGLATIYGIVKQNNGFINVYSEPGQGTSVKIYLPRHTAGAEAAVEPESPQICSGSETILLVEDEPSLLEMATQMLELWGYQVLAAGTPEEALRLAREHTGRIDLLMTDVVMPAMNGRDLAHKLMRLHPELKCLFMSGYTANVIAHHGVLDEGVHFIQKPFAMQALNAKLREALA